VAHDPTAVEALFTIRKGDDFRRAFTSDDDVSNWGSPLMQIRSGPSEDAPLLASSEDDDTAEIVLSFDFLSTGSTLEFFIDDAETASLPAGPCWLHLTAQIGGDVTTVLFRSGRIVERVAVAS
jgi:hypothetical protein